MAQVLAKHIQFSGGQAAFDKLQNRVTESKLEIVGQGITIGIKLFSARPNKFYSIIESEVTGKVEKGCTGEEYWENSLIAGPVLHEGSQKLMGLREATFERFVYWQSIYESAECVGTEKVDELECFEVVLRPKKIDDTDSARPVTLFIDNQEYLIRKVESVVEVEAGEIPVVAFPGDYKEVDGIKLAHSTRMEILGQKRMMKLTDVKHNVDLPDDRFELPDELRQTK